jgi:hypothetical protein
VVSVPLCVVPFPLAPGAEQDISSGLAGILNTFAVTCLTPVVGVLLGVVVPGILAAHGRSGTGPGLTPDTPVGRPPRRPPHRDVRPYRY